MDHNMMFVILSSSKFFIALFAVIFAYFYKNITLVREVTKDTITVLVYYFGTIYLHLEIFSSSVWGFGCRNLYTWTYVLFGFLFD